MEKKIFGTIVFTILLGVALFAVGMPSVSGRIQKAGHPSFTPCPVDVFCGTPKATATPTSTPTATPTSTPTATPTIAPTPVPTFTACGPVVVLAIDREATIEQFAADGCTTMHLLRNASGTHWVVYGVREN